MTNNQFNQLIYNRASLSTQAARLVLVEEIGVNEAARRMGVGKASVSRAVNRLRGK